MKKYLKYLYNRAFGHLASKADIENLYNQLSALMEVRDIVGSGVSLGPLRGWALSPDALLYILRDIQARPDPRVVEFGSGESTMAIAALLRKLGRGSLLSIEHDKDFADRVMQRLAQNGLGGATEMRVVPLRQYEGSLGFGPFKSYDLEGLETEFDVAVVDGPVTPVFGTATRMVPLEWSIARLQAGRAVYADDTARAQEQMIFTALRDQWKDVDWEILVAEKGMCRLMRHQ